MKQLSVTDRAEKTRRQIELVDEQLTNGFATLPASVVHREVATVSEGLGSQFTPSDDGKTFEQNRTRRRQRNRVVGFLLCFALWVLSVIPLARESMHGREGTRSVAVYIAVAAITLGVAAVIRGMYILLSRGRFWWSPWVFLIAAVAAISIFLVQSAGPGGVISAPSTRAE